MIKSAGLVYQNSPEHVRMEDPQALECHNSVGSSTYLAIPKYILLCEAVAFVVEFRAIHGGVLRCQIVLPMHSARLRSLAGLPDTGKY